MLKYMKALSIKSPFGIRRHFKTSSVKKEEKKVRIAFIEGDGRRVDVMAEIGKNLLDVAHRNNIELEGACGGELACSTCHLVFEKDIYDKLPAKKEEEDDMLDLAFGLTDTSRLGCQIIASEVLDGAVVRIPADPFDSSE
eukprot:CAMPEP_0171455622 /NCGR_PEP_ID=MMETSP0945-20130129/2440_1 /TAXON_ID=109269 /ORGANISM="Vaucheria litorea, Strain CCMP2940" /LENGTH=139 /DNA_ID=CAMNT_0011980893 /DNA_START=384 /DNA_END=803 /DNA_ORIENTATION=-